MSGPVSAVRPGGKEKTLAILAVILGAFVYFPVTRSYFFADDFLVLVRVADGATRDVLLEPFGGHLLVARNALFAATFSLFGLDPRPYHWSIFALHLVNVWLLFRVLHALTADAPIACLGAVLWATCPVHAMAVGWYAASGQVVATTMLLVAIDQVVRAGPNAPPSTLRLIWWCGLLLVGAACFGTGIGAALVFPVAAVLLLPDATVIPRRLTVLLALPLAVFGAYRWLTRRAPVAERTATFEAIALGRWIPIVIMLGHLLAYGTAVLTLGFFVAADGWPYASPSYPGGISWAAIAVCAALLAIACGRGDANTRRRLLGAATLAAGVYGIIALGRANLAPEDLPRWAGEARYHYEASVPLAMMLSLALREVCDHRLVPAATPAVLLTAGLAAGAAAWARSNWQIETFGFARRWVDATLREVDAEIDRGPEGGVVYLPNADASVAVRGFAIEPTDIPGRAAVFVLTYPGDVVRGRRVRFVEHDPHVLARYRRQGGRLARLLVEPQDLGTHGQGEDLP